MARENNYPNAKSFHVAILCAAEDAERWQPCELITLEMLATDPTTLGRTSVSGGRIFDTNDMSFLCRHIEDGSVNIRRIK